MHSKNLWSDYCQAGQKEEKKTKKMRSIFTKSMSSDFRATKQAYKHVWALRMLSNKILGFYVALERGFLDGK